MMVLPLPVCATASIRPPSSLIGKLIRPSENPLKDFWDSCTFIALSFALIPRNYSIAFSMSNRHNCCIAAARTVQCP
jgi:hypothetical protein